jgi:phage-related protein
MSTAMSFAASLNQSLVASEGNIARAADLTDQIIIDMADNANRMGTDMEMVQNAYAGFAKSNFTLLDNLKLGYAGTKEEMQRLLDDAEKLSGIEYDISSFADITEAIHVMQTEMGIAGATAEEASGTISGSLASAKSAWSNLITGIGTEGANLDGLIDNFVNSAATAGENLMPRISKVLDGLSKLINKLLPKIMEEIPKLINSTLPTLINSGVAIITALGTGLINNIDTIIDAALQIVDTLVAGLTAENIQKLLDAAFTVIDKLCTALIDNLPTIIATALTLITALANGLSEQLPVVMPQIVSVITQIAEMLSNPETLGTLVDSAIAILLALADGLIASLPILLNSAPTIISNLVTAIIESVPKLLDAAIELLTKFASYIGGNLSKIYDKGAEVVSEIIEGVKSVFSKLVTAGEDIINKIKEGIKNIIDDAVTWGTDLVQNFIDGIKKKMGDLKNCIKDIANAVKSMIGFSEPEEGPLSNFHTYAPDMMQLFAKGIKDNENLITDQFNASLGKINTSAVNIPVGNGNGTVATAPQITNIIQVEGGMQISNDYDSYRFAEKVSEALKNLQMSDAIAYGGV